MNFLINAIDTIQRNSPGLDTDFNLSLIPLGADNLKG